MNNQGILLLELLVMSWDCGLGHAVPCWPGLRLHKSADPHTRHICLPCENGTFMAEKEHMNEKCNNCSDIISPLEIVITTCNITHDTEIQCISGYYRRKAQTALENDTCEECRTCESGFPARPCLGYNDTVCCPLQHDAVWTCEGKYECQERPACGAGMYYNTSFDRCLSCPNGTYMQAHYHTARECVRCEALSGNSSNHAVILHPCTRTSPTVFGCEDFHYRASDSRPLLEEAPCRPCQTCSRYLRQCQILHDAVCAEDSLDHNGHSTEDTGTGGGQTTDVPESCPVTPSTQTSIYQTSIILVSEMLLYVLLSPVVLFKHFYTPGEGYQLRTILRKVPKLYGDYYLSLFIVSILFQVLIFMCGYFGLFARYDLFSTLAVGLGSIAFIFILCKLLFNYIKDCLKSFWGIVNRWLIARKDRAHAIPVPQAESFINDPQSYQRTTV